MGISSGQAGSGSHRALAEINVTPFVDVMLVLLIIFMVSAPMLTKGIDIGLPQAVSSAPIEEDRVTVTVDRAGQYFVDQRPVIDDLLVSEVKRSAAEGPEPAVFLEADAAVPFGRVVAAMDRLRAAGIARVALVTEPVDVQTGGEPAR